MRTLHVKGSVAFVALFVALLAGCRSNNDGDTTLIQPQRLMQYIIGPSDVLTVTVLNQPDMARTVTVRPDGMISYPLVDEVYAAGLGPDELEELLTAELSEFIQLVPGELTVDVEEVHSYTVSVLGEVRSPGRFEFQNSATVLDALAEAGGLTEFASRDEILILRTEADGVRRILFDYDDLVSKSPNNVRLVVYPGDTVLVP